MIRKNDSIKSDISIESGVRLLVIAIAMEDCEDSYPKTSSGLWDFGAIASDDYVPIYIIDYDINKVIHWGLTTDEDMYGYYDAFVDGLIYAGVKVEECYGVYFTPEGSTLSESEVLKAIENNLIEEAE
jgi:hypothetical protein